MLRVCLDKLFLASLFYYSAYFCYYSWALLHFLVLVMDPIVLFQLTFTFFLQYFQQKIFSFSKMSGSQTLLHLHFKFYYIFIYTFTSMFCLPPCS